MSPTGRAHSSLAESILPLIERKKAGGSLSQAELDWVCNAFVGGEIPDYQMAAWLMAVRWRGMTTEETLSLTRSLVQTGSTLDWSWLPRPPVDKHSTGGVGDKTTLVLVPLVAAAGVPFVKMSGRGLGHTGGTADKLEAIPGIDLELTADAMRSQVERIGCALVTQSPLLAPGDAALYALRDVTGTVDSIPLIASSIMSKKLAAGAPVIVIDVKYGSGGFMRDVGEARELARLLVEMGKIEKRKVTAVITPMEQPLGNAVGNAVEVKEAIETLRGGGPADLWELTIELGTQLMILSGAATDRDSARHRLNELRASGDAARKFEELIAAQHGDPRVVTNPERLPRAEVRIPVTAPATGWVARCDARQVAEASLTAGAGRPTKNAPIDLAAGIVLSARVGSAVEQGEPIAEIHANDAARAALAAEKLHRAYRIVPEPLRVVPVPIEVVGAGVASPTPPA